MKILYANRISFRAFRTNWKASTKLTKYVFIWSVQVDQKEDSKQQTHKKKQIQKQKQEENHILWNLNVKMKSLHIHELLESNIKIHIHTLWAILFLPTK